LEAKTALRGSVLRAISQDLARLLLGDRFQTTSAGAAIGFSLLFEMNTLFEEYVARMLARAVAGTGLHVVAQGGRLFCLETEEKKGLFQTKPDILVKRGNVVEQVIDTKWKRISSRIDDPKQGVAQADVYQMMAYGQLYRCSRLMLLYPHHHGLGPGSLRVNHRIAAGDIDHRLELATVDVSTSDRLTERLLILCPTAIS
jgi:5-methylcytosine-specific restriction enzyme subunit McrC